MIDAIRLAVGTFTILRVPAPVRIDQRSAGGAMLIAPLIGLAIGAGAVGIAWVAVEFAPDVPLLAGIAVVGFWALATRALHLDGLADVADGLGSGKQGADALAVMRRSDIGPFGVITLVLVLTTQIVCAAALAAGAQWAAITAAAVVGRVTVLVLCTPWFPSADGTGLGSAVAGSVRRVVAVAVVVATLAAIVLVDGPMVAAAGLIAITGGLLLARRLVARIGGISGDVLGAALETATTVALVGAVLALT